MAIPRFHAAIEVGETYEVGMNHVQRAIFDPTVNSLRAIGTRNLNGCTAVAIISPLAAILAHIPPQPYATTNLGAGMQNVYKTSTLR